MDEEHDWAAGVMLLVLAVALVLATGCANFGSRGPRGGRYEFVRYAADGVTTAGVQRMEFEDQAAWFRESRAEVSWADGTTTATMMVGEDNAQGVQAIDVFWAGVAAVLGALAGVLVL